MTHRPIGKGTKHLGGSRILQFSVLNWIFVAPPSVLNESQHGSLIKCVCTWYADGRMFDPHTWKHSFMESGHETISMAILSLLLIQEGQLSVTNDRMCTKLGGARWLSGRVSDSGARGRGFETYRRRVVSLSKTLYSPKVLVNYPGSGGSVLTWLKNCWLGR